MPTAGYANAEVNIAAVVGWRKYAIDAEAGFFDFNRVKCIASGICGGIGDEVEQEGGRLGEKLVEDGVATHGGRKIENKFIVLRSMGDPKFCYYFGAFERAIKYLGYVLMKKRNILYLDHGRSNRSTH